MIRRREKAPEPVAALVLGKGERLLAWCAVDASAGFAAATSHRFILLSAEGERREWAWHVVIHGSWADDRLTLTVPAESGARQSISIPLSESGAIPLAVRERVSATVAADREAPLPDGTLARCVARRPVGESQVRWTVVFPAGVDAADPARRAAADAVLADLRETLGL